MEQNQGTFHLMEAASYIRMTGNSIKRVYLEIWECLEGEQMGAQRFVATVIDVSSGAEEESTTVIFPA